MNIEDHSIWNYIVEAIGAVLAGLFAIVWHENKKRITDLEAIVALKADKIELDRQRDHVAELFRENAAIRKDMNGGFQRITDLIHSQHIRIMTELAKKADR